MMIAAAQKFSVFSLGVAVFWCILFIRLADGKPSANTPEEITTKVLENEYGRLAQIQRGHYSSWGYFNSHPLPTEEASNQPEEGDDDSVRGRQYFGVTNVFGGSLSSNQSCPNSTCPVCNACPTKTACPNPPKPSQVTNTIAADALCLTSLAQKNSNACSKIYLEPSGSFTVGGLVIQNYVFITIIATCPLTTVKLSCSSISGLTASTQSSVILQGSDITETSGTMEILLTGTAAAGGSATCSWISS